MSCPLCYSGEQALCQRSEEPQPRMEGPIGYPEEVAQRGDLFLAERDAQAEISTNARDAQAARLRAKHDQLAREVEIENMKQQLPTLRHRPQIAETQEVLWARASYRTTTARRMLTKALRAYKAS